MLIIPAIDLQKGKVVRLVQGDYLQSIEYGKDPVHVAEIFMQQGAQRIHVVDLEGALCGKITSADQVRQITQHVTIPVEFGGGIRCLEDIAYMFDCGVDSIILGTKACEDEGFLTKALQKYGNRIIVGVDAKDGKLAIKGWTTQTQIESVQFIQRLEMLGVACVIYTDIATDGMLKGHNSKMTEYILSQTRSLQIIASGGVGSLDDIRTLKAMAQPRLFGVIVGRALYEQRFTLKEAIAC